MTTESILLIGRNTRNAHEVLGAHPRITDAVHAEVEKQRALTVDAGASAASFEAELTRTRRPVATDGEGV